MKKFICAFLCVIFLCSCSSKTSVSVVNRNISYRAHIFYYGEEFTCLVSVDNTGRAEYTLSGGALDGFTVCFYENSVTYSYLEKDSPNAYSFCGDMLSALYEMNEYFNNEYRVKEKDGEYKVSGYTLIGDFEICVSPTGLPLWANLDGEEFYVEFYDVALKKQ